MSNVDRFLRGAAVAAVMILTFVACASAADIIDDWAKVQPPPPPKLKAVTLDGPTTALIFMDMNQVQCAQNPRCAATVPAFRRLYEAGRAAGAMFWYSLSNDAKTPDMIEPGFAPKDGEWEKTAGAHQVTFGTHLLEKLQAHNIKTAVLCGHSWQAVVVGNALDLTLRGYKVIVPVDCNASNMPYVLYLEQYSAWWAYKSEDVGNHTTLTRSAMIKFQR